MGNIEILGLSVIVMYVLFVIARRLWPKREDDERTTAPFVKRRQRAMIWTTTLVGIAAAISVIVWRTPQLFPRQLNSHQFWTVGVDYDSVTAQGRTKAWVAGTSKQRHLEPLEITFESGGSNFRVSRELISSPWTDASGNPVSASDIVGRFAVDSRLTGLVDAVLTGSWVEGGLHDRAQPSWQGVAGPYPTQPTIARTLEMSSRTDGFELMMMAIQAVWVASGILIVAGLGLDRWKFKQREPSDTVFA